MEGKNYNVTLQSHKNLQYVWNISENVCEYLSMYVYVGVSVYMGV